MHAGRYYSLKEIAIWTQRETMVFCLVAIIPTALYSFAGWKWLTVSWPPIAVIGTAVAFITGFKNNASYARLWEARQIWGGIINSSRTFGILVLDFISDRGAGKRIIHRHFAWLTALRYQLRESRTWENTKDSHNAAYRSHYEVPEWEGSLDRELAELVDPDELSYLLARKNRATQLMHLQSSDLRQCAHKSLEGEMKHLELQRLLALFVDAQGKCERIKNFPYPRQFATLNLLFVWLFIVLLPLGLLPEFQKFGNAFTWMAIPVSVVISWVFHTMDKIGESSENPFEGGPNDVPITAMCRTIEIDLREMLGEETIPAAVKPVNNILM